MTLEEEAVQMLIQQDKKIATLTARLAELEAAGDAMAKSLGSFSSYAAFDNVDAAALAAWREAKGD